MRPASRYPTEPEEFGHRGESYRVWSNGPGWWMTYLDGIGRQFSTASRDAAVQCGRLRIDEAIEECEAEEDAAAGRTGAG